MRYPNKQDENNKQTFNIGSLGCNLWSLVNYSTLSYSSLFPKLNNKL